eukprot:12200235-Alexandrium_andersonii.AAC.1
MSASLVGSEMCIRDRSRSPRVPRNSSGVLWSPPKSSGELQICPGSSRAVSYTHLTLPTICSV